MVAMDAAYTACCGVFGRWYFAKEIWDGPFNSASELSFSFLKSRFFKHVIPERTPQGAVRSLFIDVCSHVCSCLFMVLKSWFRRGALRLPLLLHVTLERIGDLATLPS